jgi:predicted nucleotidyltransferase
MIPVDKNRILVEQLYKHIEPLLGEIVLVGGCAVGFLITDETQLLIRATDDVDLATEIMTLPDYYKFTEQLKNLGFSEDTETGVICRWRKDELCLDVMPLKDVGFGSANTWYPHAFKTAVVVQLSNGSTLRHIDAPTFIATKIESFLNRGGNDFVHHDIEDIITVVNGREELPGEISEADQELQEYLSDNLGAFLEITAFTDLIPSHIRPNENRAEIVFERLRKITGN